MLLQILRSTVLEFLLINLFLPLSLSLSLPSSSSRVLINLKWNFSLSRIRLFLLFEFLALTPSNILLCLFFTGFYFSFDFCAEFLSYSSFIFQCIPHSSTSCVLRWFVSFVFQTLFLSSLGSDFVHYCSRFSQLLWKTNIKTWKAKPFMINTVIHLFLSLSLSLSLSLFHYLVIKENNLFKPRFY